MYTTYFLKFDSEASFDAVMAEVGYKFTTESQLDEDGNVIYPATIHYSTDAVSGPGAIDQVGTIYNDDAVYGEPDEEGMPTLVTPATAVEGFHVNLCLRSGVELPAGLSPYVLDPAPATPARTFG